VAAAGQGSQAIAEYESALRLDPHLRSRFYLGISFAQSNRVPEAIASYERALAIRPEYEVAHNNLAVLLCNSDRWRRRFPITWRRFESIPTILKPG